MEEIFGISGGVWIVVNIVLLVILIILWIFLPITVLGIKDVLDKILNEIKTLNSKMDTLELHQLNVSDKPFMKSKPSQTQAQNKDDQSPDQWRCPQCKKYNSGYVFTCEHCGYKIN